MALKRDEATTGLVAALATVMGFCIVAVVFVLGFAFVLACLCGGAAVSIWAINTLAGHVVIALVWKNVAALAALLWIVGATLRGSRGK